MTDDPTSEHDEEPPDDPGGSAASALAAHRQVQAAMVNLRRLEHARTAAILELRAEGWTYKQIGALLGIAPQRVHQLAPAAKGSREATGG